MHEAHPASADQQLHSILDTIEDRFTQLERQVLSLQRLAAMGTASASLAHEVNNMLTPILSYCQFALQRDDAELMKLAVEKTVKNINRLSGMCRRISGMASGQKGETTQTPVLHLIAETIECLGRDLRKDDIELSLDIPPGLTANVDAVALQQVIFNLLLNSRQAMGNRGGRLTVRANRSSGGILNIDVADTGPGIPDEYLERVFEPFFSTKSGHEGTGLGLHICRQLMHEMGGEISVTSTPGAGTTFRLTIPG